MAMRAYRRDSRGRFAGGGGGKITFGKAGGFRKGATQAFHSGMTRARDMSHALGARKVGKEYYVTGSVVSRTLNVGLMRRPITMSESAARMAARAASQGLFVNEHSKLVQRQRAMHPGSVVKSVSIKIPTMKPRKRG